MRKTDWVGIRLPSDLHKIIIQVAEKNDRAKADMIRVILKSWLKRNGYLKKADK
jgi:predicted transcriptional regulator